MKPWFAPGFLGFLRLLSGMQPLSLMGLLRLRNKAVRQGIH